MQRIHIFISGIVQGVNFRRFVKEKADESNIKGYVKNTEDLWVEAVFEGSEKDLEKIINNCKKGPLSAKVNHTDIIKEKYKGEFKSFEIIR